MDVLTRIIRMLLDELEDRQDTAQRLEDLEQWREQVEATWPQITEDE